MSPNINFKGANASFSIIIQIHDSSKASKGVMELKVKGGFLHIYNKYQNLMYLPIMYLQIQFEMLI